MRTPASDGIQRQTTKVKPGSQAGFDLDGTKPQPSGFQDQTGGPHPPLSRSSKRRDAHVTPKPTVFL